MKKHLFTLVATLILGTSFTMSQYAFDPESKIKEVTAQNGIESIENIYINYTGTDSLMLHWSIMEDSLSPWDYNICDNKGCYFGYFTETKSMNAIVPATPGFIKLTVTPSSKELRHIKLLVWEDSTSYDTLVFMVDSRGLASNNNQFDLGLSVYPNPVVDVLKIQSSDKSLNFVTGEIFTLEGKSVMNNINIHDSELNVSSLAPGNYLLSLTNEKGQTSTVKFIK